MLRLSRDFPSCTHHVAAFIINNQARCKDPRLLSKISAWAKSPLASQLRHSNDFEASWRLLVCAVLRIDIEEKDIGNFDIEFSSVILAIMGVLKERSILKFPLSKFKFRHLLRKTGIYGENWLPYYEAVRRKWTKDKDMIAAVTSDPILSRMLSKDVTFIEERAMDISHISLVTRIFRGRDEKNTTQTRFLDVPSGIERRLKAAFKPFMLPWMGHGGAWRWKRGTCLRSGLA